MLNINASLENCADGIGDSKAVFVVINSCAQIKMYGVVLDKSKFVCVLISSTNYSYSGVKSLCALTGSLSLSGMLSMDILEPGLDSDSRSSLDLRSVS